MKKIFMYLLVILLSVAVYGDTKYVNISSDWKFTTDSENQGDSLGYGKKNFDITKWQNMPCNTNMETVIGDYDGYAWYARDEVFSKESIKKYDYIYLYFKGVDEEAWVYINGKQVLDHSCKNTGLSTTNIWCMPFSVNIKPYIKDGLNRICVKINDSLYAGGIYAPVKIVYSDKDLKLGEIKSIAELNPDFKDKLLHCKGNNNFSLLWFSDIHGDAYEYGRLTEFYNCYSEYIDCVLSTGDNIENSFVSDFSYWNSDFMFIMGNHDMLRNHKEREWTKLVSQKEAYEHYFKPFIEKWNVKYAENLTYYYKDFEKIRLICLNCMLGGQELIDQCEWLKTVLTDAREKNLSVVMGSHFPAGPGNLKTITSPLTEIDSNLSGEFENYPYYKDFEIYLKATDEFIKTGGDFVCWIGGHFHKDYVCYNEKYPNQLQLLVGTAGSWYDNNMRVYGERSMDLANLFIVDTNKKVIKIIRVGGDTDQYLRDISSLCINYKTYEIIK